MYVDCFAAGRVMSAADCRERVENIFEGSVAWRTNMLAPATGRMWISRLLQNLVQTHTASCQWTDVAAMLELQMLVWPQQPQLKRDLALALARVDMTKPASLWMGDYLKCVPDDPEHDELTDLLDGWSKAA